MSLCKAYDGKTAALREVLASKTLARTLPNGDHLICLLLYVTAALSYPRFFFSLHT